LAIASVLFWIYYGQPAEEEAIFCGMITNQRTQNAAGWFMSYDL
jgi:hypothetical protein